jgi:ribonuclease Z
MTAAVRILTTSSMDSSPSILLIAPDGSRILVDCGEGCQRSFLEYRERLSTVRAVCISHLSASALGGLPGMILTSADSIQASVTSAPTADARQQAKGGGACEASWSSSSSPVAAALQAVSPSRRRRRSATTESSNFLSLEENEQQEQQQDLTLLGPVGMKDFMHALRHFVRREKFHIQIREGGSVCDLEIIGRQQQQQRASAINKKGNTKKINKKKGSSETFINFFITSLVFDVQRQTSAAPASTAKTDATAAATGDHGDDDVNTPLPSGQKRPRTNMEADTNTSTSCTANAATSAAAAASSQTISYLFTTPPIPGKLQPEKAAALGIPKGPLLAQLKAGKTIAFINKDTGMEQVVQSHQVVSPPSPGIAVLVLRYPIPPLSSSLSRNNNNSGSCTNVDDNKKNEHGPLNLFFQTLHLPDLLRSKDVHVELILHLCTKSDFESNDAVAWRKSLHALHGDKTICGGGAAAADGDGDGRNIVDVGIIQHILVDTEPKAHLNGSPHLGAAAMAQTRAILSSDIFLTLSSSTSSCTSSTTKEERSNDVILKSVERNKGEAAICDVGNCKSSENSNAVLARPMLEYILLPRSKRGVVPESVNGNSVDQQETEKAREFAKESGAKSLAESVLAECGDITGSSSLSPLDSNNIYTSNNTSMMGQLIFAGTASAIPCKYRNVTGMCLTDTFGRNMLLDIGEGTIGQLLRVHHHHHDSSKQSLLSSITAVWISHPHADHHLGILRLLEERQQQRQTMTMLNGRYSNDPVIIIAPPPIFDFLREYAVIVPSIADSYHAIDCRDFLRRRMQNNTDALTKLQGVFKVTGCHSVQVQHCPFSYAVILEGTSFGTLVYSGDCRPSHELAKEARGADVLIHEATFEDGMEAEAALKRHCTVGEALRVAQEMQAKCLVLTHFSQRYPKIPPTPATSSSVPIIFAFDFMRLTPRNLLAASKLTPALRLLYPLVPGDDDEMEAAIEGVLSEAELALSVPGLFAQSNLL